MPSAVNKRDELFDRAAELVRQIGYGSPALLQRKLAPLGYGRASRLTEQLIAEGVLGELIDGGPRRVAVNAAKEGHLT